MSIFENTLPEWINYHGTLLFLKVMGWINIITGLACAFFFVVGNESGLKPILAAFALGALSLAALTLGMHAILDFAINAFVSHRLKSSEPPAKP